MGNCSRIDTPNEEGRVVFISSGIWQVTDADVLIVPAKDLQLNEEPNLKNIGMFKACGEWDPQSTYSQQDRKRLVKIVHTKSSRLEKNNRIQSVFHYIVGEDYELNNMTPTMLVEQLGALFELCVTNNFNRVAIHARIPGTYNISIGECAKIYKSVFETYQQIRKIKIVGNGNEIKDFKMQYNLENIGLYQNHQSINPERQKQENVIILENQAQKPKEPEQRQQESQQNGNQEPQKQKDIQQQEKELKEEKQGKPLESTLGQQFAQQNENQEPQEQEQEVKQEKQEEKPLESALGQKKDSEQNGNPDHQEQKDIQEQNEVIKQENHQEKLLESAQGQQDFQATQPINQETSSAIQTLESNVTPKLKIIVEHENIVNLRNVDAIVNSANSNLFESAGLCGDIYTACGSQELDQRCMEYREQYGPVQTSQVAVTGSCNLVQQKIISILHAVGPKNSKSANSEKELHNCLINIFVKLKYASIAIPAIASGSKGFGKLKCAQIFLNAIQKFRNEHCEIEGLVRLTNKDQVTYEIFNEVFRDYL